MGWGCCSIQPWADNEVRRVLSSNKLLFFNRKIPVNDGDAPKSRLELREENHLNHSVVRNYCYLICPPHLPVFPHVACGEAIQTQFCCRGMQGLFLWNSAMGLCLFISLASWL